MKATLPIIFIVGPTAVGKTELSLQLAGELYGEIVSCDAMQVYREISVASSKPSLTEQQRVRHHLLDVVSVGESFDVATFNQLAHTAIDRIHKGKKVPVVVGGSGLYMQVLLDGLFENGGQDAAIRQELAQRVSRQGLATLYAELQSIDPQAAQKIHPHDQRRIIRALEVYLTTKTPISQMQKNRRGLWGQSPVFGFCLNRERAKLYDRINQRVEQMFIDGLVEEIKTVSQKALSLTAQRIIGVREVQAFLRGDLSLEQAKEQMKMNTRRFAKRQLTWFRKDERLQWLDMDLETTTSAVKKILKGISKT